MPDSVAACASEATLDTDASYEFPAVCIIVPTLNEQSYITACIESLLRQDRCSVAVLIVVDGGSTDLTIAIVRAMMATNPLLRLVHNPKRIQSAAINLASAQADPATQILIRADAHVTYPPDFVAQCVTDLRRHEATSVVVPMRTVGESGFQRAVAFVQNSRLGNGGAAHRVSPGKSGFVDHGHHAAFDRGFFNYCNGYDESFTHNEDAELDYRAVKAGGKVWLCANAQVNYFPRKTPLALGKQYFQNGAGRAKTLIKHRLQPRLRQMAPVIILINSVFGLGLTPFWWPAAMTPLLYVATCCAIGATAASRERDPWLLAAGPAAIIMHLSYALGFLQTLAKHAVNYAKRETRRFV